MPDGYHLAEFNLGILKYDWDDPRIKDFADGVELVNGIAMRSPGFVWMLDGATMEAAQKDPNGPLGSNPRTASTLSVWESAADLELFVWTTVHSAFYNRKLEWYDETGKIRLAMWWVAVGQMPSLEDAMQRIRHLEEYGSTDFAFGWDGLEGAELWKTKQCGVST